MLLFLRKPSDAWVGSKDTMARGPRHSRGGMAVSNWDEILGTEFMNAVFAHSEWVVEEGVFGEDDKAELFRSRLRQQAEEFAEQRRIQMHEALVGKDPEKASRYWVRVVRRLV